MKIVTKKYYHAVNGRISHIYARKQSAGFDDYQIWSLCNQKTWQSGTPWQAQLTFEDAPSLPVCKRCAAKAAQLEGSEA